jgi:hypothetical protein
MTLSESRKYARRPMDFPAWIETPRTQPLPCRLDNLSPEGAQISVHMDWALPARFVLRLTADGKLRRGCRVIWQKEGRIGVRFFALPDQKPFLAAMSAASALEKVP